MTTNKMWGGRFESGPAAIMREITPSISFDRRLAAEDIAGSKAHARMLGSEGIIPKADSEAILKGLDEIEKEIAGGKFAFKRELEDIHLNIEARLAELIGPGAGRLHTARSRNDQVATDFRLWVRAACARADEGIAALQRALLAQAGTHAATVMPGFTHMQPAQPVTFGHHCLAYIEMLARDRGRFCDAAKRLNDPRSAPPRSPARPFPSTAIPPRARSASRGRCAIPWMRSRRATSRSNTSRRRQFSRPIFRGLAGEFVQWSSPAFGFVKLSDAFTTGSSIMPQKRNPDAAELVRGKTGRVLGDFVALAAVVKGLVLAYGSDLQEDKERVFDAADTIEICLAAMTAMTGDLTANPAAMCAALEAGFTTATDLADWIVRVLAKPFREAHNIAGAIVKRAEEMGVTLDQLPLEEMWKIEPAITRDVFGVLSPETSAASRASFGGTAPTRVREQIAFWTLELG